MISADNGTSQLLDALKAELASKPAESLFTAAELGMLDNLHTRGFAATVDLANAVGVTGDMHVLDIGSGLGGPARYLAETFGCHVEGIDTQAGLLEAADYLSLRWIGPRDRVTFGIGDAVALPFADDSFDLVWMQHVAMNVADRDRLYSEIRRVLLPRGRFATYDVLRANAELIYPTPWAAENSVSTVLSSNETREALERNGLSVSSIWFDTLAAIAWARATAGLLSRERPTGAQMMRAALGKNFREILGNLGRNYLERRADVAAIIAQRPAY